MFIMINTLFVYFVWFVVRQKFFPLKDKHFHNIICNRLD